MQIGIVGLPFAGKSTLFQTITKTHLDQFQLAKTESHHAIIKVPDDRLDRLTETFKPQKTTNAAIEFVDVIGLQKGDSGSSQFTGNFLASVKTNDALIQVVHLFDNDSAPHPLGSIDMMRDINIFETEFILSDLGIVEKRIDNLKKQILKVHDDHLRRELALLEKCYSFLQEEKPLRETEFLKEDFSILKNYQLLTLKPMLIALNLAENQIDDSDKYFDLLVKAKIGKNTKAIAFFGQIELEMSELDNLDAQAFMKEYGIKESALTGIIREAYNLLGLQSFFTVGEDECRAWTIHKGMNAQDAAGVIHSDFYNKFIRAEVVHYNDFISSGSFAQAKEHGLWRLEGKEYIVKDGDILTIRHN
ncbi:MAG: redox-regulated ATPase YchF [Bacteroidetes bacterium]|nr:redox-regulated ATPase YchF [Bacteroidota bacterium]